MARCLIGLGSNQGAREELLQRAVDALSALSEVNLIARSAWHEFAAVGGPPGQPGYLNGAVLLETSLGPHALLAAVGRIERQLGRTRGERWGPRPIDIDLLLFDQMICSDGKLVLPHPRMAWRRFVLKPAAEIAPEMVHPQIGWTVGRLLQHLDTAPFYVALTGAAGMGKSGLAEELARRFAGRLLRDPVDPLRLEAFWADPASHAWHTELQFLEDRTATLDRNKSPVATEPGLWVSDFWFDQSLAFARVWLSDVQFEQFERHWRRARERVLQPRLIVLLDHPGHILAKRVGARGRVGEKGLSAVRLEEIRRSIRREATAPGKGPVLVWQSEDLEAACKEVGAAIEAMR